MDGLSACLEKMRREGLPDAAIETFRRYYEQLAAGERGLLPEPQIEPVESLPDAADLPQGDPALLAQTVVIKLNGGLGTSMGMTGPKSLLEVKEGLSFLDVIARQVLHQRERFGVALPLVLMNSFATREPSLAALDRYPDLGLPGVPADFVQHKEPKVRADDLQPVEWPADRSLEWCPPGHGDLYVALESSGALHALLDAGYRYAFVSNVDNLGATLDLAILSWFADAGAQFALEAADRTEADRKGGHLARRRSDGHLVLRELAQTPDTDADAFQDVDRHRYFNTNNLWLDLTALADLLDARGHFLGLPMIVNRKTVDPTDPASPPVYQLETAMGSAIGVFDRALALRVPRLRLAPVKTTDDLLALRSDAYVLTEDGRVELAPERDGRPPVVALDPQHYKLVRDLDARFRAGAPSLRECTRLTVRGDVTFGGDVVVRGEVTVEGPASVPDGAVLQDAA